MAATRISWLVLVLACASCGGDVGGAPAQQPFRAPQGTTLEGAYILSSFLVNPASVGPYAKLAAQPGYPVVVRTDLGAPASPFRFQRRRHVVSFIHFSDLHIIDAQSPLRLPFLRRFVPEVPPTAAGLDVSVAYRAQDVLTPFVTEAMVRQANTLRSPVSGEPIAFAVSTGDHTDGKQFNELRTYIDLLDGGPIVTDTSGQGYVGVQDQFFLADDPVYYDQYWHPDPPPSGVAPDMFKREFDYPEYPGLLQSATASFIATGLDLPWYAAFGNHDGLLQGNLAVSDANRELFDQIATGDVPGFGSVMFLDIPSNQTVIQYLTCLLMPTAACIDDIIVRSPKRPIPSNTARAVYSSADYIAEHLASPGQPRGHGFSPQNLADDTLYYTFPVADGITGIMLDTVNPGGGANGSIGATQAQWLIGELCQLQRTGCPVAQCGAAACAAARDEVVVLFSHHNLDTMNNPIPGPDLNDPDDLVRLLAPEIKQLLLLFPNVILWVNGHSHIDRIVAHPDPTGFGPGFWEVNTASHVDYPQQSRVVEVIDNRDGTLSIYAILFDHAGPIESRTDQGPFSILDLAAISRELSANDPILGGITNAFRLGSAQNRNVELLVRRPF